MKKSEIIEKLINITVNPNWEGKRATQERIDWRKELEKKSKKELLIDLENCNCEP